MPEILLRGCSPEPLASYLKALAVLRLVAEQVDSDARGAWRPDGFALNSTLDEAGLVEFFLERYAPTPVIAPWSGGSGFYTGKDDSSLRSIAASTHPRWRPYQDAIHAGQRVLERVGIANLRMQRKEAKARTDNELVRALDRQIKFAKDFHFLPLLRSELPDAALPWFDAAVVLVGSRSVCPPLLGTGGNDGNLDFTNNQMQRLVEVLMPATDDERAQSRLQLSAALFGDPEPNLGYTAIGQFHPAAAGGPNSGPGFDRAARVNPWDYVLTFEGASLFASTATKRLGGGASPTTIAPFMVQTSSIGYASASAGDDEGTRHELWLPVWDSPASLRELQVLLAEGRAKVGTRDARTGVDFARAIASLGVDRGIHSFARFGFHARNGRSYYATPLQRLHVRRRGIVDLLAPLDAWIRRLDQAPQSVRGAARSLEAAIVDLCSGRVDRPTELLIALGDVERALSRSRKHDLPPTPPLAPEWLDQADDGTIEFALARSLASTGIRERIVRVRWSKPWQWQEQDDGRTVWGDRRLVDNLIAVVEREEVERAGDDEPIRTRRPFAVDLAALQVFLDARTDDSRLEQLLRGLAIVDFSSAKSPRKPRASRGDFASTAFAVIALARCKEPRPDVVLPRTPGLIARIASGDCVVATALAASRLRGAGLIPRVAVARETHARALRIAAALAFPLSPVDIARLAETSLIAQSTASQLEQE